MRNVNLQLSKSDELFYFLQIFSPMNSFSLFYFPFVLNTVPEEVGKSQGIESDLNDNCHHTYLFVAKVNMVAVPLLTEFLVIFCLFLRFATGVHIIFCRMFFFLFYTDDEKVILDKAAYEFNIMLFIVINF